MKQKFQAKSPFDGKQNDLKTKFKKKSFSGKRAFPAENDKKKKSDQQGMRCSNCGLTNHRFEDCFKVGGGKERKKEALGVGRHRESL